MEVYILTQFDDKNFASCCHRFLVSSRKTVDEINSHNNDVDHQQLMLVWNGLSTTKRGNKPKMRASLTQELAYMCCRMHCLNRVDSYGRIQCNTACENAVQFHRDDHPSFDKNVQCSCLVCKCPYSVLFYCRQSKK